MNKKEKRDTIQDDSIYNRNIVVSLYSSTNDIDDSRFKSIAEKLVLPIYLPDLNYSIVLHSNKISTNADSPKSKRYLFHGGELSYLHLKKRDNYEGLEI